jgi:hypothetical protein
MPLFTDWLARRRAGPPSAVEARVAAIEARFRAPLPPAFRHYLCHAAPSATYRDLHGTDWWSPDRIERVLAAEGGSGGIAAPPDPWLAFADRADWGWTWALHCGEGAARGTVALVDGADRLVVADSFDAFVLLALPGRTLRLARRDCKETG